MEDSRNIIKAIDALTLKAGGEVVDSKNITEAIDHLKAVYDQEAIGIDKTLTQEGLAADAKAVGNKINYINLSGDDKKYRITCGAVRADSNGWHFIVDDQHQANMNVITVSANESGQLVIDFGITAKKVVSFVIAPDENFARLGYFIGASVGKTKAVCEIYQTRPSAVSATIYYDTETDSFKLDKTNGVASVDWDTQNGRMIINHDTVDNNAPLISLTPFRYGRNYAVPQTWTATATHVKFFDLATGNTDNVKSNKMELTFCRADMKKLAYNLVDANAINNSYANFWFIGIFEV